MKKTISIICASVLLLSVFLTRCKGESKQPEASPTGVVKEQYQCPMKCTEQLFDKPGKCPECEMELIKVTKS